MTVSLPGPPVPLPAHTVDEIVAAVRGLPRQRAPARRPERPGVGAARGVPRPGRGVGARRGTGHPRRPPRGGPGRRPARRRGLDPGPDRRPGRDGRADDRDLRDRVGADGPARAEPLPDRLESASPGRSPEPAARRSRAARDQKCQQAAIRDEQHDGADRPGVSQGGGEGVVAVQASSAETKASTLAPTTHGDELEHDDSGANSRLAQRRPMRWARERQGRRRGSHELDPVAVAVEAVAADGRRSRPGTACSAAHRRSRARAQSGTSRQPRTRAGVAAAGQRGPHQDAAVREITAGSRMLV